LGGISLAEAKRSITLDYYDLADIANREETLATMQGILKKSAKVRFPAFELQLCELKRCFRLNSADVQKLIMTSASNCPRLSKRPKSATG
jgi:hypothetical protein